MFHMGNMYLLMSPAQPAHLVNESSGVKGTGPSPKPRLQDIGVPREKDDKNRRKKNLDFTSRSSSREVGIRVLTVFYFVYFSRGTLPKAKGKRGPRHA